MTAPPEIHQPLLSLYRVAVDDDTGKQTPEHVGRCFCGWHSVPYAVAWRAGEAVRRHVEHYRRRR